jgi:hypothetical protein
MYETCKGWGSSGIQAVGFAKHVRECKARCVRLVVCVQAGHIPCPVPVSCSPALSDLKSLLMYCGSSPASYLGPLA